MTLPYLHYYESRGDLNGIKDVVTLQLSVNGLYALDFFVMLAVFGAKEVLFKRSWALRVEVLLQLFHLRYIAAYR